MTVPMSLFKIKTLRQRLALFLLLPTALFLLGVGFLGFIFARSTMLDEWNEAAILKLQRAAHHIDMRLSRPVEWIEMFHKTGGMGDSYVAPEWILQQLRNLEGITGVNLQWKDGRPEQLPMLGRGSGMGSRSMMRFNRARIAEVTPPSYDAQTGQETVSIISHLKDESGRTIGELKVAIRFDYLLQDIQTLGWWQSDLAYLVDKAGRILAHTESAVKGRKRLGDTDDPLEVALLEAIHERPFGTLRGSGHPPRQVGGFYQIKYAPWIVVLFAPGEKILAPIVRFRLYYSIAVGVCILLIILLIRSLVGRTVGSIADISRAAEKVSHGDYGDPLPITTSDEIGQLTESFNTMVKGLKERDFISNTFGRYVDQEIARELLRRPEARRLGGERRKVAILMSDLRNFTLLSESLTPEDTIRMLNRYFSRMIEIIQAYQGIIVDFVGDALLVFFDPLDRPILPSIRRAIRCALEMQEAMNALNVENGAEGLPQIQMGIGINAGEVVVGNIGSELRAKYGIVGAPVNLTQRLQTVADVGQVVISEPVYRYAHGEVIIKKSFSVELKGVREMVTLYVIGGLTGVSQDPPP